MMDKEESMTIKIEDNGKLEAIRAYYDSVYYRKVNSGLDLPRHLEKLAFRVGIHEKHRVLDVACGSGEWLLACSRRGAIPYGVDLSRKAIEACQSKMANGTFFAQPAETLPFENEQFDIISCLGALEHFVDPRLALREMVRVAKKDAKVLILVPNADFLTRRLGLYTGTSQIDAKEEVWTLHEWQELLADAGLDAEEKWRDLHVLSWSWISSRGWHLIPLRLAQAAALVVWPLKWQYQVYHLCRLKKNS